jgi:pSer/pThr/pTyr-binding forkhead associated (FHA) protein
VAQATAVLGYLEVLEAVSRMNTPIPLQGTLIRLGRSPAQCEIAFENDITMSRLHANLQREGSDYRLFDENSTSGSFVNERQVPEYGIQLVDGDEIHLGAVHLRYRRA